MAALLASPWALSGLTAGILLAAVATGRFWTLLAFLPVLGLLGWALFDGPRVQQLALWSLFLSQYLMVVTWLRPDEFNYFAYAVIVVLLAGIAGGLRGNVQVQRTWWFLVWLLISAVYSTIVLGPSPAYVLLVVPLGAAGMVLLLAGASDAYAHTFLRALMIFAVLQAALGVSQTLFDLEPFAAHGSTVYFEARNYLAVLLPGMSTQVRMATGTFEHFNGLGALLSLVTPIAFGAWLEERSPRRMVTLLAVSAGLVATFSRGALLGASIGSLLVYWSVTRTTGTRSIRMSLLALVGILSGLTLYQGVRDYAVAAGNLAPRLEVWIVALQSTVADPVRLLFGAGFGYFGSGFLESIGVTSRVHSAPVQVFSELGSIGVVLFVLGVLPPIRRGLRSSQSVQTWLAGGAIAFLAHQVFDNGLFGFTGVLFFGVVAVLIHCQRPDSNPGADTVASEAVAP